MRDFPLSESPIVEQMVKDFRERKEKRMKNESADYQRGYDEAIAVHGVAHQPGFFKSREEADLVTQAMWQAGLNETEAKAQRSDFLTAHRQREQKISGVLKKASAGGDGRIVKPSSHSEEESIADIYERRKQEMCTPHTAKPVEPGN